MFWFDFAWDIQNFLNQFWWQINFALLVILVLLGYLAYKQPAYAVGLTIVLLPTYLFRSYVWFLPFTFLELCIWVLFVGWLVNYTKTYHLTPYHWPILLILLGSGVGLATSPNLISAAGLWKAYLLEPIMFFIVLRSVLQSSANKTVVLTALGLSSLAVAWLAIYQKFTAFGIYEPAWTGPDARRVTAMFSSPNAVGLYLAPIIAIYSSWLLGTIKLWKIAILKMLIIVPALAAIFFTGSQGAWLGLAAALGFILFFGWNKKLTVALVMAAITLCLIVPLTRHQLLDLALFQDASGQNRLALWELSAVTLSQSFNHFTFGLGIGGFAQIQDAWRNPLTIEPLLYPHNILLNFWVELGLLGALGFGWVIINFFTLAADKIKFQRDWLALGAAAAMMTIIIHGLVDVPYFKNDLAVLFWIIVGLL